MCHTIRDGTYSGQQRLPFFYRGNKDVVVNRIGRWHRISDQRCDVDRGSRHTSPATFILK